MARYYTSLEGEHPHEKAWLGIVEPSARIMNRIGEKKMARRKIVAGNWKMNKTPSEAVALVEELKPLVASEDVDVVFCVPAIDIIPVVEACKGTNIQVGS